ncbi:HEAT repeat domain-containing protein [Archangium primigenium]|uniref:HEAT repeat domain-containing protein n=1 Tax=[Archangium] primigenium TaxID=2792470 RepID=UPI0019589C24|nr:HEAT repeat domain-containing protein [Archangium primigenium]
MSDERPDALLRSALEKIVYFEARAEQLHHELTSTRAELEHLKREVALSEQRELELRSELAQMEVRMGRVGTEREELTRVNQALRTERGQLLGKLLEASRIRASGRPERDEDDEDGLGIDLASFISQLRSEVLERPGQSGPGPKYPWPSAVEAARAPAAAEGVAAPVPVPVPVPVAVPALATVGAPAAGASASSVVQHAWRLQQEGRLAVSAGQLAELSGTGAGDESLFGFSVRELSAPDATSRVRAAERLKALGQPAAAPALASALHAEDTPSVQVALLAAFAEVGKEQGASVVSPLLSSRVPEVRIAALKALLSLSPQEAAPHLAQAVKDPDRGVRRRASLLALGLEGENSRRLGEEAIHDPDVEVRSLAALALGAGSGESARTLLLEALKDSEVRVRRAAAQSLGRILGQDVSAVVELDEGRRRREIRRLATLPVHPVRATLTPRVAPPRAVALAPAPAPAPVAPPKAAPVPTPAAAVAPRPTVRAAPSPVEALCAPLLAEIRVAIRGRSLGELATSIRSTPELAQEALALLVARGSVVRRGHKYFAS